MSQTELWIFFFSCLLVLLESVQVDGHNETVQSEHLGKDEDKDHADKEARLLRRAAHPRVTHYADGVAGGQAGQTHGQASPQVNKASEKIECS